MLCQSRRVTDATDSDAAADLAAVLLAAYDDQLRGGSESADVPSSTDGPVIRVEYPSRGFVSYRSLEGLDGTELNALIARQRDYFGAKGQSVEWKTRGHDLPHDLPERLTAAGFVPEERETVVIAQSADIVERLRGRDSVDGITIRRTSEEDDFARIAAMESTVWIYKALVAVRAARAVELGYRYLQVDASDDSSPILQRLGFIPVTTTTPYVHTPGS